MLGYELSDLDNMIKFVGIAHDNSKDEDVRNGLAETYSFLQGLWAEGYFD